MQDDIRYAGFWLRVLAFVIDSACVMAIVVPLLWLAFGPDIPWFGGGWLKFAISVLLPAVGVVLLWLAREATPGKWLLGMRIVDAATRGRLGTGQAVLRYLGYYVSTIPLGMGLLWVAFDEKKQGWHDKLARTVVVRDPPVSR